MKIRRPKNLLDAREKSIDSVYSLLIRASESKDLLAMAQEIVDLVDADLALPARSLLEEALDTYFDYADPLGVPENWVVDSRQYLGRAMSASFFDCPSCHAGKGEPCVKANGTRAKKNHSERKEAVKDYLSSVRAYALREETKNDKH